MSTEDAGSGLHGFEFVCDKKMNILLYIQNLMMGVLGTQRSSHMLKGSQMKD